MINLVEKYGELLSNISEMSEEEAKTKLKTIVKNLNIEGETHLIDFFNLLNDASNKHPITVDQLVDSVLVVSEKMNVKQYQLSDIIEYSTSIGAITRESGRVIGNSLVTVFTRVLKSSLDDLGIDTSNVNVVNYVKSLIPIWKIVSEDTKNKIAIDIAGRYHVSRFSILMDQLSSSENDL